MFFQLWAPSLRFLILKQGATRKGLKKVENEHKVKKTETEQKLKQRIESIWGEIKAEDHG